jgi:cell division protein FtsI (penicillin-binding protein 3)
MAILGLFAAVVLARYIQLAIADPKGTESAADSYGERGAIVDRNGRILAMDVPKYDVSIWRPSTDAKKFPREIPELAAILEMSPETIVSRYTDSSVNYFYIARRLTAEKIEPLFAALEKGKFVGVQVDEVSGRLYPEKELAAHLLGFTGEGNKGLDGIEIKYDGELAPKPRKSGDGTGRLLSSSSKVPRGDTVTLTIDANLQYAIESILGKARIANGAEGAIAVAMDVRTGEILAYVSQPGFDLNNYSTYDQATRSDPLSLYSYEPGSVFKIFTMATVLDLGGITPSTVFNCDGAYRRTLPNGEKIVIKDLGVYGKQNLAGILAHSSNAGVGYASDTISEIDLYDRLKSFGFGMKTGVGLSGESPGSLHEPGTWSARSKPTIALGQEVQVTALQMIQAAAAIANGGMLLKPVTVKSIQTADGENVFSQEPQAIRRVVSETTARSILDAMEAAATLEGTGWRAKVADVRMAVKTGTAQMIDHKTRAYSDKDYIASTLGIFPADNPRVALYIALIKPRGASYLGGQIAAPVLREATEAVLSLVNLDRGKTPTITHDGSVTLQPRVDAMIGALMPDLKGYPKGALLGLLERRDIRVVIEGDGYVVSQEPPPGAAIDEGAKILLKLK